MDLEFNNNMNYYKDLMELYYKSIIQSYNAFDDILFVQEKIEGKFGLYTK